MYPPLPELAAGLSPVLLEGAVLSELLPLVLSPVVAGAALSSLVAGAARRRPRCCRWTARCRSPRCCRRASRCRRPRWPSRCRRSSPGRPAGRWCPARRAGHRRSGPRPAATRPGSSSCRRTARGSGPPAASRSGRRWARTGRTRSVRPGPAGGPAPAARHWRGRHRHRAPSPRRRQSEPRVLRGHVASCHSFVDDRCVRRPTRAFGSRLLSADGRLQIPRVQLRCSPVRVCNLGLRYVLPRSHCSIPVVPGGHAGSGVDHRDRPRRSAQNLHNDSARRAHPPPTLPP